jgi:hypothetical protein
LEEERPLWKSESELKPAGEKKGYAGDEKEEPMKRKPCVQRLGFGGWDRCAVCRHTGNQKEARESSQRLICYCNKISEAG